MRNDGWNYWSDGRVRAGEAERDSLILHVDEQRMQAYLFVPRDGDGPDREVLAEHDMEKLEQDGTVVCCPCVYVVCPTCHGRGSHVNPSVDCDGLTADDFAEDPDFAEDYMSGCYDEPCRQCKHQRVVVEVDRTRLDPEILKLIEKYETQRARDRQEAMWERRMGC